MFEFDPKWLAKLDEMRAAGVQPYPDASAFPVTHTSTDIHERCVGVVVPSEVIPDAVCIGGRVIFRNHMGKAMFLRVQDRGAPSVRDVDADGNPVVRGGLMQVYLRKEEIGEAQFDQIKKIDIGDFVWVRGVVMRTKTGELSVQAIDIRLAGKILQPFPDRFHGVEDIEYRSRQRYVDLFMNADSRDTFRMRSAVVRYIRNFFDSRGFMEVETPMMHVIPGGAAARPFITHHNTLDIDLYLRIAPELYLKRLVVGGFERVFEVNRNFRNEGISLRHNPEFTMLEFYWAWATYRDLIDLTEALLVGLCTELRGTTQLKFGALDVDMSPPFRRAHMDELIAEKTGLSHDALRDPDAMLAWWNAHNSPGEPLPTTVGKWWEKLFECYVEKTLVNPTFVTGFPAEISPLARRSDDDAFRTDRFELFVATWELCNAFTELNDPVDQAERFLAQVEARAKGDDEGMFFDADYIRALSFGMPPTAGEGIGIDRLVMLLTGRTSIREVILFPTLRPDRGPAAPEVKS
jgi:lysyl-tRNA synthetase class 2